MKENELNGDVSHLAVIAEELRPILRKVRQAKELLGRGGADCAYKANKELESVLFRLSDLVEVLGNGE
jgi:hypothetical protein